MIKYKPTLCVVAGPNGSGKTTLTQELLPYAKEHWGIVEYVNPDEIALSRFGGYSEMAHRSAAEYAQTLRDEYIKNYTSFLFETVLSSEEKVKFIQKAIARNYFVRLFFIATNSPDINIARIGARVMGRGHDVPAQKTIERYRRSLANLILCIPLCHRVYVFDNSIDQKTPLKIFRTANGYLKKRYTKPSKTPVWCEEILDICNFNNACICG